MSPAELRGFLKELRITHGFSQGELARRCQVSPATISLWESGGRQPPLDELIRWGTALGVKIELQPAPLVVQDEERARWETIALALEVMETATDSELAAIRAMMNGLQRR